MGARRRSGAGPPDQRIDDDAFISFDATTDGIEFFESLEGMRVTAQDLVAIAPTNSFGEIYTAVHFGASAGDRTPNGGLSLLMAVRVRW